MIGRTVSFSNPSVVSTLFSFSLCWEYRVDLNCREHDVAYRISSLVSYKLKWSKDKLPERIIGKHKRRGWGELGWRNLRICKGIVMLGSETLGWTGCEAWQICWRAHCWARVSHLRRKLETSHIGFPLTKANTKHSWIRPFCIMCIAS